MLGRLLAAATAFIVSVISAGGYPGIVLLMAIESACIPLPSEIIMPFERWGRFVLLGHRELELAERWFARWGRQTVFWARLLPVVRTFIALPAGIAQMELGPFVWLTFAGSLPWCWALAYAGFKLAENWNVVHEKMHGFDTAVGVLVALVLAAALLHRVRALRTAARQHPPAL